MSGVGRREPEVGSWELEVRREKFSLCGCSLALIRTQVHGCKEYVSFKKRKTNTINSKKSISNHILYVFSSIIKTRYNLLNN